MPARAQQAEAHGSTGGPAQWLVGVGRRCITPRRPLWLYGYVTEARFRPAEGVLSDLYASALALRGPDDSPALILAVDLCVPRGPLARSVVQRVQATTGVPPQRVLLNASHTHSGPALAQCDVEGRFPMPPDQRRLVEQYTDWMVEQVAEAASEAMGALRPGVLSWGRGQTDLPRNRRQFGPDGKYTGMGPNPDGPVDPAVPVLRMDGPGGALRAVLFGCACHNVTLDAHNLLVSADYSGFAREAIEEANPGAVAIYLAGCGADANPQPRGGQDQVQHARSHGRALAAEVGRVLERCSGPVHGPLQSAVKTVELPLQEPDPERLAAMAQDGPPWLQLNARRLLAMLECGEDIPSTYPAPVSVWQFGGDLTLVGLSGEVVSAYAAGVARTLATERLWVAGYCHEVFGYLPSAQIIAEGGYETRGLLPPGVGFFAPAVEQVVLDAVRDVACDIAAAGK